MNTNSARVSVQSRMNRVLKVSRIAWIVCLVLMTVRLGNALRDLVTYGWNMPWWYPTQAVPAEMQAKVLSFERLSQFLDLAGTLVCYGLFAALFRAFETGSAFSATTVRIIRYLGCWYISYYVLCLLAPLLCGLPSPSSPNYILAQIQSLLIGAGIVVASWIMEEGKSIQEEQALTI